MADPTGYAVSYSFTGFQNNSPTTPLPAPKLDIELANIATAVTSIVSAVRDIRREDGALNDGIVTFDSLALAVQLMLDPDDATLVANAVAAAQTAAASAGGSASAAAVSAAQALASALAAAASAASVDLTLFLPKAGNLAGLGSVDTSLANLQASKIDSTNVVGRLAPITSTTPITDWNSVVTNGWFSATSAANQPVYASCNDWVCQVIAHSALYVTQIAYPYSLGSTSVETVVPHRRQGYNNAGVIAWKPWQSAGTVPVGTSIMVNGTSAPAGYLKENGALVSRTSFPALWAYAQASGNLLAEASWGANFGCFSTGDLSTTFRLPDNRGVFIRGWDDAAGRDAGRGMGSYQADALKDHTHSYNTFIVGAQKPAGTGSQILDTSAGATTGGASIGAAETRPVNLPKLMCIKY